MLGTLPPRFGQATLTDCDREPIQVPGSIQPHGCLFSICLEDRRILQYAGDLQTVLGLTGSKVLGEPLETLLGEAAAARIWAAQRTLGPRPAPLRSHAVEFAAPAGRVDGLLHRQGPRLILECLPALRSEVGDPLGLVQAMLAAISGADTVQAFCEAAAEQLRAATGFDRVMIYRFLEDGAGMVAAEARCPRLESFLGLHYPESDIPKQARELYLRNWVRAIPDVRFTPAPLQPERDPKTGEPLDLGFASLRSVSPLHTRYLENMGVAASMSLSIVVQGRLWGLIACHQSQPYLLPRDLQAACEVFAQVFCLQLTAKLAAEEVQSRLRQRVVHQQLVALLAGAESLSEGLTLQRPNLLDLIGAEGVAVWVEGEFAQAGRTPGQAAVAELAERLNAMEFDGVFASDRLEAQLPGWARPQEAAGVLALSVSRSPRDWVFWFRPEVVETVTWAGDPNKAVRAAPGAELSPRSSFAAWRETVRGRSKPWSASEIEAAQALRVAVLEVVLRRIDQLARERQEANERQALLVAELDHRVKNMLANIQALMRHTRRSNSSLDGYVEGLERRLKAMAHTQTLLSASRWRGAELRRLIEDQLRAFELEPGRLLLEGEALELSPKAALSLSMVLHELATNAAKYGALSQPGGALAVRWRLEEGALQLHWRESQGPEVAPPTHRGFGRTLIERSLAYELRGAVALRFPQGGAECDISIPARFVLPAGAAGEPAAQAPLPHTGPVGPALVLLVEDCLVTALDAAEAMRAWGYEVLGPCGSVEEALALIALRAPDAAVLDINLGEETSFAIADALQRRAIPFVFLTAYDAPSVLPPRHAGAAALPKPYTPEQLRAALARALAPEQQA